MSWAPPDGAPTRLLLVRHGATAHSSQRRFSGRNDLPLDPSGQAQAAALAQRLAGWADIAAVLSSPLLRARQTAAEIAARLSLPVAEREDLAEIDFGAWEGRTMREVAETDPDALRVWTDDPRTAPPGGESFADLEQRVRRCRNEVLDAHRGRTVALVSHVTPIKTLVRLALDAPPSAMFRLHLDPASLSAVDHFPTGEVRVSLVNDTAHLSGLVG